MNLGKKQIKAYRKINKVKVGALFMEPGTGKTRVAYNLVNSANKVDYLLYLAPYRVINSETKEEGIKHEINKCGGFSFDVDFIGIESFSNSDRIYLEVLSKLEKAKQPFVICDESIKIKNVDAKRTQRIIQIGKLAQYKLVLNGTPLTRNLLDLWAQMEFLSPDILGMGYKEFVDSFVEYSIIKSSQSNKLPKNLIIRDYHNMEHLYSLIDPFVFQSNLDIDVKKKKINIPYHVEDELKRQYEEWKEHFLSYDVMDELDNNIFLAMTQKMQQSYCCAGQKFEIVKSILENHKHALIFCKYDKSEDELKQKFPNARILKYGKHSYGLNLQNYNCTIFFDKSFDYGMISQAENRTYRTGQTETCYYYDLTGNMPLEDLINNNINRKVKMLDYFKSIMKQKWDQKNIVKKTFTNLL